MFDRLTVLVVDDQDLMRSVTANQLRSMGWQKVLTARHGADALRQMRAQTVDVLLTDWNMPVMNGLELLRAVRSDSKLAQTPVLMITAETSRERIQDVISSGVSGLLVKPYNAAVLRDRLERVLQMARSGKAAPQRARSAGHTPAGDAEDAGDSAFMPPPATVLVVDDNPTSLSVLERLFKDEYEVLTATRGQGALRHCQADTPPDLILMDVQMPEMDGFQTVRQLRESEVTAGIPVIFVTADTSDDARREAMELGAVDLVTKATSPRELRQRVRNFLRFVDMRRQLQSEYDAMLENARLRDEVEQMTRHDLKGSLSGIVGMVGELVADEDLPPRYTERLQLVQETATQALNAINLSGDLFKMETGRFQLHAQPVALGDLLRRIVEGARAAFTEKELGVVVDTDMALGQEVPQAQGDEALCHSLFSNLVKNACEAAPRKTQVLVKLFDESPLRIIVQNKGVVPYAIRDVFFNKYVTQGKKAGSGLGTYSARMLALAQHGSIEMQTSDEHNLTTLTVWLPRHQHPVAEGTTSGTSAAAPAVSPPAAAPAHDAPQTSEGPDLHLGDWERPR